MKTCDLFSKKTVFSFEVFPPKKEIPVETVYPTLEKLSGLHPDFISVTCGAGGKGGNLTVEVASKIKSLNCETAAHLPCINLDKDEVLDTLTEREQKVLRLRFGMDDGRARTLEEVGKEFQVTRERIRQIEAKALRRLRHPSKSRKLKDYLDAND